MRGARVALGIAAVVLAGGCSGEELGPPAILSFTVDPATVAAGGDVTVAVEVENFEITGEEGHTHDEGEATDGHEHEDGHEDEVPTGHVHIYLDDLETNPVLMLMAASGTATLPAETAAGPHVLIARLHGSDHKILEPQVTAEADLEVTEVTGGE